MLISVRLVLVGVSADVSSAISAAASPLAQVCSMGPVVIVLGAVSVAGTAVLGGLPCVAISVGFSISQIVDAVAGVVASSAVVGVGRLPGRRLSWVYMV
jgi:hypothetical protein